jgi:hypothetical protein
VKSHQAELPVEHGIRRGEKPNERNNQRRATALMKMKLQAKGAEMVKRAHRVKHVDQRNPHKPTQTEAILEKNLTEVSGGEDRGFPSHRHYQRTPKAPTRMVVVQVKRNKRVERTARASLLDQRNPRKPTEMTMSLKRMRHKNLKARKEYERGEQGEKEDPRMTKALTMKDPVKVNEQANPRTPTSNTNPRNRLRTHPERVGKATVRTRVLLGVMEA